MKKGFWGIMLWLLSVSLVQAQSDGSSVSDLSFRDVTARKTNGTGLEVENYKKMAIFVKVRFVDEDTRQQWEFTEKEIQSKVEKWLADSQIDVVPRQSKGVNTLVNYFLYVNIHVVGLAFNIRMDFRRPIVYEVGLEQYEHTAPVFQLLNTGYDRHKNKQRIFKTLDDVMKLFLQKYLEANQLP